ncbi:hypothetical protein QCD83_25560, partial [Pseudomonas savastanoi pv. phaseolicola]|nr:hypothetical protein [Pseudomonas savastanoi pv. phaseolicola]MDG6392547.1 hypothetical protein [Pseudomonas savastanoi pv. phaseolicola]
GNRGQLPRCCIGGLLFGRHTCTSSYMLCPNTKFLTVSLVQQYKKSQKNLANPIQNLSTPPSYKLALKISNAEEERVKINTPADVREHSPLLNLLT